MERTSSSSRRAQLADLRATFPLRVAGMTLVAGILWFERAPFAWPVIGLAGAWIVFETGCATATYLSRRRQGSS